MSNCAARWRAFHLSLDVFVILSIGFAFLEFNVQKRAFFPIPGWLPIFGPLSIFHGVLCAETSHDLWLAIAVSTAVVFLFLAIPSTKAKDLSSR